jgi:hypothetical protein
MMTLGFIFRDWMRDERGTITIEFLLWLPVLSFWLVASTAFFDAYKSRGHASKAAHVMSDITSRQVEVTETFVRDLYALQAKLLPGAPAGTVARITSVRYSADEDHYEVLWSTPLGGGSAMTDHDIPRAILPAMANFDTVIVTELSVPYQPFTQWANIEISEWSFAVVSRPRYVSAIAMIEAGTVSLESTTVERAASMLTSGRLLPEIKP